LLEIRNLHNGHTHYGAQGRPSGGASIHPADARCTAAELHTFAVGGTAFPQRGKSAAKEQAALLALENISACYGSHPVLRDISL